MMHVLWYHRNQKKTQQNGGFQDNLLEVNWLWPSFTSAAEAVVTVTLSALLPWMPASGLKLDGGSKRVGATAWKVPSKATCQQDIIICSSPSYPLYVHTHKILLHKLWVKEQILKSNLFHCLRKSFQKFLKAQEPMYMIKRVKSDSCIWNVLPMEIPWKGLWKKGYLLTSSNLTCALSGIVLEPKGLVWGKIWS